MLDDAAVVAAAATATTTVAAVSSMSRQATQLENWSACISNSIINYYDYCYKLQWKIIKYSIKQPVAN